MELPNSKWEQNVKYLLGSYDQSTSLGSRQEELKLYPKLETKDTK